MGSVHRLPRQLSERATIRTRRTPEAGLSSRPNPQAVLLYVIREALQPDWSPLVSGRRLAVYAQKDLGVLRLARARLLHSALGRLTPCQSRAVASLSVAISDIEDSIGEGEEGAVPESRTS